MSRRALREYLEEGEITAAARSKAAKKAKRQRATERFHRHLVESIERMEANGNPAAAEVQRNFWRKFAEYRHLFPTTPRAGR